MDKKKEVEGILYGILSYVIWGIVPIYWKFIDHVSSTEILAHRVLWSFVFMIILLLILKQFTAFKGYIKDIRVNKKKGLALFIASLLVSANWGLFIWAVNSGRILDTSLGYYINPIISVLLGVIVLKEKLSKVQVWAVALAFIGVGILTIYSGSFPWTSFLLAITFALYGLAKKLIHADAAIGLTLETMMITPFAVGYLLFLTIQDTTMFFSWHNSLFLIGGGVVTALPLLFFAMGANYIPLSFLGFLQYIAPTLTLLIGVFIYHEAFTKVHAAAFLFIWSALILFSFSQLKVKRRLETLVDEKG